MSALFLADLGSGEIVLILLVIVIFFGSKKIPELARGIGKGIYEVKKASADLQNEITQQSKSIQEEVKEIEKDFKLPK